MRFAWDEDKNRSNLLKPDVRFETALLVFEDPYALSQCDDSSDQEERWITLGATVSGAILFVVHAWFEVDGEEVIRIISARAAESHERKAYEEAHQGAKARRRRHRGEKRRRH
jgi:hypothetical protein